MNDSNSEGGKPTPAEDLVITTRDGASFDVPEEGSLALLALGYRGLLAWRAKRIASAGTRKTPKTDPS